jgi:hypothetical protein
MSVRLLARLQKLEAVLKPQPKARIFRLDLDERDGDPADQEARIAAFKLEHDVQPHDILLIITIADGP